jgi:hypothetical protein
MTDLRDADDRIAAVGRLHNGNVARYNAKLKSFPALPLGAPARVNVRFQEMFDGSAPVHD